MANDDNDKDNDDNDKDSDNNDKDNDDNDKDNDDNDKDNDENMLMTRWWRASGATRSPREPLVDGCIVRFSTFCLVSVFFSLLVDGSTARFLTFCQVLACTVSTVQPLKSQVKSSNQINDTVYCKQYFFM